MTEEREVELEKELDEALTVAHWLYDILNDMPTSVSDYFANDYEEWYLVQKVLYGQATADEDRAERQKEYDDDYWADIDDQWKSEESEDEHDDDD
jgi:hypothetical protein